MSDERIIENIKKLRALGMTDSEIVENLVNIGLLKEESENLVFNLSKEQKEEKSELKEKIKEIPKKKEIAKKTVIKKTVEKEEIPDNFFSNDNEEEIIETTISDDLDDDYEKSNSKALDNLKNIYSKAKDDDEIELNVDLKNTTNYESDLYKKYQEEDLYKKYTTQESLSNRENINTDEIWQKGLVTTINSKLTELEGKQKSIEEILKTKIEKEINELKKMQNDIKKEITINTDKIISGEIDKLNAKIITEIAKLKITEAKTNTKLQVIEQDKEKIITLIKEFNELRDDLKKNIIETKKRTDEIVSGTEENITKIITTINIKLNEKIKEINSTLALQSKITEGLVKNTQTTVIAEIKKINEFKSDIKAQIDPKRIYDKINELEDFKIKLSNRYDERFEKVKTEFLQKAKSAIKNDVDNELKELNKLKTEIVSKTDPERIEQKLKELKKLEEDVINSVDIKIEQSLKIYQASMNKEFKDKMIEIDNYRTVLEKSKNLQKELEEKIKEIDRFKKQFIAVIDENIEKMNQNMNILLQQRK